MPTYDGSMTDASPRSPERAQAAPAADPSDVTRAEVVRRLEEVDQHDAAQAQAAAATETARERLFGAITDFVDVARPAERVQLARRLYWTRPDLNVEALARALRFAHGHQMREMVGTWPTGQLCGRCGHEIRKTSRSGKPNHSVPEYEEPICVQCWEVIQRERNQDYDRQRAVAQAIAAEPVVGPRRWAYALARIVAQFPPATADIPEGYEQEFWRTHQFAVAIQEQLAHEPLTEVGVSAASRLMRGAQGVASWHPREVAAIVTAEVGDYTFSDLTEVVEREIDLARQRVKARRAVPHLRSSHTPRT